MTARVLPSWLEWPQTMRLIAAFNPQPESFRFVGGAVRDAVLGLPVADIDAASTLTPQVVIDVLAGAGIKAIPTGIEHGTVMAVEGGKQFEITTLRRDVSCDGRHAEVEFTADWKEDASRRDFTMNAMYLSAAGELFDYFGGAEDAKAGRVRFIGDASMRIREDYLRILRFFRFYAWYGKGAPDTDAISACVAQAGQMSALSGERIRQELLKLVAAPKAAATLSLMRENGVLEQALGLKVSDCSMFEKFSQIERIIHLEVGAFTKIMGFVLKADIAADAVLKKLSARLKLPGHAEKSLHIILKHYREIIPGLDEAGSKRLLRKLGREYFAQTVIVQWAYGDEPISSGHPYTGMLKLAETWTPPPFPVTGDDLIALGMTPGTDMGARLKKLEDDWELSGYTLTKEELLK